MNITLRQEIIFHIFNYFGIIFETGEMNNSPVIGDEFKIDQSISVEENDVSHQKPVWCSQLTVDSAVARVILSDVSVHGEFEFALVFRLNNLTTYGIRFSKAEPELAKFSIRTSTGSWIEASTGIQANFLAGFEQLSEIMFPWEKSEDSELFQYFLEFLTEGDD